MMSEGIYKYYGILQHKTSWLPCQPPFKGLVETKHPVKANYKSAGPSLGAGGEVGVSAEWGDRRELGEGRPHRGRGAGEAREAHAVGWGGQRPDTTDMEAGGWGWGDTACPSGSVKPGFSFPPNKSQVRESWPMQGYGDSH